MMLLFFFKQKTSYEMLISDWSSYVCSSDLLQGHVYADTPEALRRWHASCHKLYVYSSGSVDAQKLIFGHTAYGDLTPLFSGYFDTRIGGKREADSYLAILREIDLPGEAVLFLSDIGAEQIGRAHV